MLLKEELNRCLKEKYPGEDKDTNSNQLNTDLYFTDFNLDSLEEMHRYSVDSRLYEYFEFEPFVSLEDTKSYMQKLIVRMSIEEGYQKSMYWFIRRKIDDRLIGTAGLVNLDFSRKSVEWGYGIDPDLWGKGYILQIQEALKYFVFNDLGLNRLYGITMIDNHRTIESLLASGMKHEGIAREYYFKDGKFIDGWTYSMTKKEYEEGRNLSKSKVGRTLDLSEVIKLVQSVLEEEDITEESSIDTCTSWDSLSHMQIIIALTEEFDVEFSPDQIGRCRSVKEIHQILSE